MKYKYNADNNFIGDIHKILAYNYDISTDYKIRMIEFPIEETKYASLRSLNIRKSDENYIFFNKYITHDFSNFYEITENNSKKMSSKLELMTFKEQRYIYEFYHLEDKILVKCMSYTSESTYHDLIGYFLVE